MNEESVFAQDAQQPEERPQGPRASLHVEPTVEIERTDAAADAAADVDVEQDEPAKRTKKSLVYVGPRDGLNTIYGFFKQGEAREVSDGQRMRLLKLTNPDGSAAFEEA